VAATIISLHEVKRRKVGLEGLSAAGQTRSASPRQSGAANDNAIGVLIPSGAFILPAASPRA
jgi:hypothetical protein